MTQELVLEVATMALTTVITVAMPPLIFGLTVGVLVSIFQAVTSIQEPTLAFVPKILAVLFSILLFGSFMQDTIIGLFTYLYSNIPYFVTPR